MPTKNQKELLSFLGNQYTLKIIDGELCIYRKLNDRYDIEVSGTNRKTNKYFVYVWDISSGSEMSSHIIDQVEDISGKEDLKQVLDKLVKKYSC